MGRTYSSRKGPAATAGSLVLDRGDGSLFAPIDALGKVKFVVALHHFSHVDSSKEGSFLQFRLETIKGVLDFVTWHVAELVQSNIESFKTLTVAIVVSLNMLVVVSKVFETDLFMNIAFVVLAESRLPSQPKTSSFKLLFVEFVFMVRSVVKLWNLNVAIETWSWQLAIVTNKFIVIPG